MKFKCPVCKSVLDFDGDSKPRLVCDNCETTFSKEKIKRLAAIGTKKSNLPQQKSVDVEDKPKTELAVGIATNANIVDPTKIRSHSATLSRGQAGKRSRKLYVIVALVGLMIGLFASLVFVFQVNNNEKNLPIAQEQSQAETKSSEESDEAASIDIDKNIHAGNDDEDLNEPQSNQSRLPFHQLDFPETVDPKPANTFKTKKILAACWSKTKPYLVELHAQTPTGPRFATGTIVDSRGWVLTSYRAMQGASMIHVRQAKQSIRVDAERLVDQVHGFIAVMPEYDMVLLSVNRRLVDSFEDLPVEDNDDLVASQYVIQCEPPTQLSPYSTFETRVRFRAKLSEFDEAVTAKMLKRNFSNDEIRWIGHRQQTPLRHGAPLVNDNGGVVAMNISAVGASKNDLFAVHAKHIIEIKNRATDHVKPLPVPMRDPSIVDNSNNDTPVENGNSMRVVRSESTLRELSESLNRFGKECQMFDWWPSTEDEFELLHDFVRVLVLAKLESNRMDGSLTGDAADRQTLSQQTQQWKQKIEVGLGIESGRDQESQLTFNKNTVQRLSGPEQPFIGFAFVHYSALESPKIAIDDEGVPTDSVVFEFKGTKIGIIGNLSSDWPPLPPDSPWLVIGSTVPGQFRLLNRSRQSELLKKSKLSFVFQSNAP